MSLRRYAGIYSWLPLPRQHLLLLIAEAITLSRMTLATLIYFTPSDSRYLFSRVRLFSDEAPVTISGFQIRRHIFASAARWPFLRRVSRFFSRHIFATD
jgi:hypothetical protein